MKGGSLCPLLPQSAGPHLTWTCEGLVCAASLSLCCLTCSSLPCPLHCPRPVCIHKDFHTCFLPGYACFLCIEVIPASLGTQSNSAVPAQLSMSLRTEDWHLWTVKALLSPSPGENLGRFSSGPGTNRWQEVLYSYNLGAHESKGYGKELHRMRFVLSWCETRLI